MSRLFAPSTLNGMTLKNRFVRSATWEGMAEEDGRCNPRLVDLMVTLTQGGVGLIITGHAYVRPDGQASPRQLGVYKDELIPGLEEMTQAVHEKGGTIVIQLAHAGLRAISELTGERPLAPSAAALSKSPYREMTIQDIKDIIRAFAEAAARARRAGFDGVQIHSAHGYLLSQFLSPVYNHRTDDIYGGGIQNRARALLEVLQAIRKAVGANYPVLVKLNTQDFVENGLSLEDSVQAGTMLVQEGIDAIELSGGLPTARKLGPSRTGIKSEEKEAYFQDEARAFKARIHVPLILVGGIRSYHIARGLIEEGVADYVSMSRPFIREPDLINRWYAGDLRRAACISDNQCFGPARVGEGIYCVTEKKKK